MAGKTKLIKGPDGKYYTPTAYKNQWGKIPAGSAYDVETPKVVRVDSNPVKSGRTRIGNLAGGARGGMGGGMNWSTK